MDRPLTGTSLEASGPLVTAITIFLNAQSYFEEAIESVLKQTLTDIELLLVDDGSRQQYKGREGLCGPFSGQDLYLSIRDTKTSA